MRMTNRHLCLLAALLIALAAVAVPAASFAQSAGDDQYVDPFQNNGNGNGNSGSGNSGNQSDTTAGTQQTTQTPTGNTAGQSASGPAASGKLPRTGEHYGAVVIMGGLLIVGGVALRLAWPLPE
jgi:hypothetical protein